MTPGRAKRGTARRWLLAALVGSCLLAPPVAAAGSLWIDSARLRSLPTSGPAWESLLRAAAEPVRLPDLANPKDPANVRVLAKALVHARTGDEQLRREVLEAVRAVIGTEVGGTTLALGRELVAYVVAADLIGLAPDRDPIFRDWLREVRHQRLRGRSLVSTHEGRPNNWGTHAGASRIAVAAYLGDRQDLERAARVFKGWLGDRSAHDAFEFRELSWQADPRAPVGINPLGAVKNDRPIDGVLPDDQRRSGRFRWPPPRENYVYGALQGALAQAILLHNAGYGVWTWQDRALLRAFRWLHEVDAFPASGDDTWQPHVINFYYGSHFPAPVPARPGKNVGWTDWTHQANTQHAEHEDAADERSTDL